MHAKPDLRVVLEWTIAGSGSVITDVIPLGDLPMFKQGGMMKLPHDDALVWRYMDVAKLLSLLDSQSLFFPSLPHLDDPFEGYLPLPTLEEYREHKIYEEAYADVKPEDVNDLYELDKSSAKESRHQIFVNCWHANEHESAAMWSLYLSQAEGVAVQSTVGRLKACFDATDKTILIGNIEYIDYAETGVPNNVFCRAILKRKSFEHEREIRAVYHDKEIADLMYEFL